MSVPIGRVVGAILVPLGVGFSWLAHSMLSSGAPTLRAFAAGPALALLGLALLVLPGAPRTVAEVQAHPEAGREWFTKAPGFHKAAWVVAVLVGVVVSRQLRLD